MRKKENSLKPLGLTPEKAPLWVNIFWYLTGNIYSKLEHFNQKEIHMGVSWHFFRKIMDISIKKYISVEWFFFK